MSLKRLTSTLAACLLGALALSGTAAAQKAPGTDDVWGKLVCVYQPGTAAARHHNASNSLSSDFGQGQAWDPVSSLMDTDPGTLSFKGLATCTGVDLASENAGKGGGGGPEVLPPTVVKVDANGVFDNLVCGLVDIKGTTVIIDDATQGQQIEIHSQFAIQFVGSVGRMSTVVQQAGPDPQGLGPAGHSHIENNQIEAGQGTGVIVATGTPGGGDCVGNGTQGSGDVNAAEVNGAFESSIAGEGSSVGPAGSDSDA